MSLHLDPKPLKSHYVSAWAKVAEIWLCYFQNAFLLISLTLAVVFLSPSQVSAQMGGGFSAGFAAGGGMGMPMMPMGMPMMPMGGPMMPMGSAMMYGGMPMSPMMPGIGPFAANPWMMQGFPPGCGFSGFPFPTATPFWPSGGCAPNLGPSQRRCCTQIPCKKPVRQRTPRTYDPVPRTPDAPPPPPPPPRLPPVEPPETDIPPIDSPAVPVTDEKGTYTTEASRGCEECAEIAPFPVTTWQEIQTRLNSTAFSPLAAGANKAMATLYQSCESISKAPLDAQKLNSSQSVQGTAYVFDSRQGYTEVTDPDAVRTTHPYRQSSPPGNNCKTIEDPPLFRYAGKSVMGMKKGQRFISFDNKDNGLDCSGFWFSSMLAAGLSPEPYPDNTYENMWKKAHGKMSTAQIAALGDDPNSCLGKVKLNSAAQPQLRSGDSIVVDTRHAMIVETVGADPFGINSIKDINECSNVKLKNFDFTFVHSSTNNGRVGVSRVEANHFFVMNPDLGHQMVLLAEKACRARLGRGSSDSVADVPAIGTSPDSSPNSGRLTVLRHKDVPECKIVGGPVAIKGEECIASCKQLWDWETISKIKPAPNSTTSASKAKTKTDSSDSGGWIKSVGDSIKGLFSGE